jgi:hypothetical protein
MGIVMPNVTTTGFIGIGVCPCHKSPQQYTTIFVTGAATVLTNNAQTAIIGTTGVASCGHPTVALTGAGSVLAVGGGVHRIGDTGTNCGSYTVVTGSGDVIAE